MGMNLFTEKESIYGTPSRPVKKKRKQNQYKKLKEIYFTQKSNQNQCILKNKNKEIKFRRGCLQSSVPNNTNKSNRSGDKFVSEMKGKKNKVRLQNNHLAASAICNNYLSKKLNSVEGLPKMNSEQSTFSDKDDSDVFFFDLSGNKISCLSDSKTKTQNNGSVLSLSPQDVVSLRKKKQKPEKNNISKQKYSNDINYSNNNYENFVDIRDNDCEVTANGNYSLTKRRSEIKRQNKNKCSDSSYSKSFTQNKIMGESSIQRNVKIRHFENNAKQSKSRENKLKESFDFEKSFENLLECHTAQSTPIQGRDKNHSESYSKEMPKMMNFNDLNGDEICNRKKRKEVVEETKKKHKRRRSNSGDRIHVYTSSDENKGGEKGSDISVSFKRKKRKSRHNVQQSEPNSLSNNEICTTEHNNVDSSESQLINNFKKQKKKKHGVEQGSFYILSENQEIDKDATGKNHNRKHCKSKSLDNTKFDNEPIIESNLFEMDSSYYHKQTPVDVSSDNMKISGGEEIFLQSPNDEQELYSLKSTEFKKKKHKRKHSESRFNDGAELNCKSENESVDEMFSSENINEQSVEIIYTNSVSKNELKNDSSESELNISHKKRRHKQIKTVSNIPSTPQEPDEQKLECLDNTRNYTEDYRVTGSTSHEEFNIECKIEFSESKLDLSGLFTEKKNKWKEDVSFIENGEKSISVLEENSQSKSKKKKKHKADSSLDEEKTPTKRKNVKPKLDYYEDYQSQNKTSESHTLLNHSFDKKKRKKNLKNILENCQQNFENHRLMNEMDTTSSVLDRGMKGIQNSGERLMLSKTKSNTGMEYNNIEEPTSTANEPDWNMKEELDIYISDNDLKNYNSESSESDFSEINRCRNIRKINKCILSNMDSNDGAEVLQNLNIALPFTIPPLHIILKRPSKPSLDETIASQNFDVKLGAYSQEEDQMIKNNWERFSKEHDLNIEPKAFFKFPKKMKTEEKIKFLQYISHGLDNRLPQRVHNRFKILFGNMIKKTGRFTEEEDNQILEFMEMESSKTPFVDLSKILNRPSNSIERHYKRLHDQQKLVWTPSKADQLIKCMLKVAKLERPEQLKDWKITTKQWKKISKKMKGVSVIKLQRAWNITIYPRLFASGNLALAKKLIIDILHERGETDWRLIDWKEISKKFPGFTSEKLYMMFKKLVIFNVPKHLQKDIQKCIQCLKDKRIATPHKFRKYEYKNGHLVYEDASGA